MNHATLSRCAQGETPSANEPYYRSGDWLRAKHEADANDSGRSFPHWALSLAPIHPSARILDAGAGWGRFTWALLERYAVRPENVLCLDQSEGMTRTAAQEAARRGVDVQFCAGEIENLPLASAYFDGALACHVLYHMQDLQRAARELARVLHVDGWLLATTNSERIPVLLIDLHYQALEQMAIPFTPEGPSPCSMENGQDALQTAFGQVERFYFEDTTTYTNADDFVAIYATTGRYRNTLAAPGVSEDVKQQLLPTYAQLVRRVFEREGILRIPKLMGAFRCTQPIHR